MSESPSPETTVPFEVALERLQGIVQDLEEGRLGLESLLSRFEEGIGLLRDCYRTLEQAEQRIEILVGFEANGNPMTKPFDATATVETGNSSTKKPGRRRSNAKEAAAPAENGTEQPTPDGERLF